MSEPSTSEALMTDPTTAEGRAYWQERHDYEAALEGRDLFARGLHQPGARVQVTEEGQPIYIRGLIGTVRSMRVIYEIEWNTPWTWANPDLPVEHQYLVAYDGPARPAP